MYIVRREPTKALAGCPAGPAALVATDGTGAVLGGLVLLQFGITEGRAALAVPDFLVVHVCHRDIIARGVGAVVEADSIDSVVHAGIAAHQGNDLQPLFSSEATILMLW